MKEVSQSVSHCDGCGGDNMEWEAGCREEAMGDINPRGAASRALCFIIMCPALGAKHGREKEEKMLWANLAG